jgi:hypothetical protein
MSPQIGNPNGQEKRKKWTGKKILTRISHKDRCERPESAGNAGLQRQKARRHIEIFRGCFLGL